MSDVNGKKCDACGKFDVSEESNYSPEGIRYEAGVGDLCAECKSEYDEAMSDARQEFLFKKRQPKPDPLAPF